MASALVNKSPKKIMQRRKIKVHREVGDGVCMTKYDSQVLPPNNL